MFRQNVGHYEQMNMDLKMNGIVINIEISITFLSYGNKNKGDKKQYTLALSGFYTLCLK